MTFVSRNIVLLLLLFFLQLPFVNAQVEYAESYYDFTGLIPENQGRIIQKDKYGFYWVITGSGWALKWNGKRFKLMNSATSGVKGKIWLANKDFDGNICFTGFNSINAYTFNEEGLLVKLDSSQFSEDSYFSYNGNFINLKNQWQYISKANSKPIIEHFKEILIKNDTFGYQYGYYVNKNSFYISGNEKVIYYNSGKIDISILSDTVAEKCAGLTDEKLIVFWSNKYEIYQYGKLLKRGTNHLLGKAFKGNGKAIYQSVNRFYLIDYTGTIYRIGLINGDLAIEPFVKLPVKEIYVNGFIIDEYSGEVLTLNLKGGMSVFKRRFFKNISHPDSQRKNVVYTLCRFNNKVLTNQNFKEQIDRTDEDYYYYAPITQLPDGRFFYPSARQAFFLFSPQLNKIKSWGSQLVIDAVKSTVATERECYFVADRKLLVYDYKKNEIDTAVLMPVVRASEGFEYICKGPPGIMYAIISSVFYEINLRTGVRLKKGEIDPSNYGMIRSLVYDADYHGIFFCISSHGFGFLDLASGRVMLFPISNYPELQSCHYVLKDKDGDYWLPSNNGLYLMLKSRMDDFLKGQKKYIYYYRFGKEHGITNTEFNGGFTGSGLCEGDSAFLSSMDGVVYFSTSNVKQLLNSPYKGKLFISGITVDDSVYTALHSIQLQPSFKQCVIKYDFPYINVPDAILEYQLTGFGDSAWLPLSESEEVLLRRLTPGTYKLRVRVQNNPEIEEVEVEIEVKQYWYLTAWAFIIYAVILMLLSAMIFNWRINVIRNRSLREIDKSRREFFSIISHDLRSPLKTYQGMADMVSYLLKRGEYDRVQKLAHQIDKTGVKLELLLKNLLKWNFLQSENLVTTRIETDIVNEIEDLLTIYREIARHKGNNILFITDGRRKANTDSVLLSLIVRNLLDNAVKNSPSDTEIMLYCIVNNQGNIKLQFVNYINIDNNENLKPIMTLFNSGLKWEPGTYGMGMGLKMVKLAINKLNGEAKVTIEGDKIIWDLLLV